jgi:hypothetical protein
MQNTKITSLEGKFNAGGKALLAVAADTATTATTATSANTAGSAASADALTTAGQNAIATLDGLTNIGTSSTTTTVDGALTVAGTATVSSPVKILGTVAAPVGSGKVLTSDASGNATWQVLPASPTTITNLPNVTNLGSTTTTVNIAGPAAVQGVATFANGIALTPTAQAVPVTTAGLTVNGSIMRIDSSTPGSVTDLTTVNPQISSSGIVDGQLLIVKGKMPVSGSKVKFYHGRGLRLSTPSVTIADGGTLTLMYDAVELKWIEVSRSLNQQ